MIENGAMKIDRLIREILQSCFEIRHIALIDRAGLLIRALGNQELDPIIAEKIAVIGQAMFQAGENSELSSDFGQMNIQITEYTDVILFSSSIGLGIIIIITEKRCDIQYIRLLIKKYQQELDQVIRPYCEETSEVSSDIKSLLGFE